MSDPLNFAAIKSALADFQPVDPVVLDLLPPETAVLVKACKEITEEMIKNTELLMKLTNQTRELSEALKLYSTQIGDPLFARNLELCLRQVRAKKG